MVICIGGDQPRDFFIEIGMGKPSSAKLGDGNECGCLDQGEAGFDFLQRLRGEAITFSQLVERGESAKGVPELNDPFCQHGSNTWKRFEF